MQINALAIALALLAAAAPLCAMEISLEENRGERGSIGFVDLQAVFRRFPETQKAKQSYAEIVRQAEEQVNLRRAELIRLRSELANLRSEREAAANAPIFVPPPTPAPEPAPQAAPAPEPAPAKTEAPASPDPAAALTSLPGMNSASTEPLKISIPGLPEEEMPTAAEVEAAPPAEAAAAPAPAAAAPSQEDLQARAEKELRERDQRVKDLDAALAAKQKDISDKESGLVDFQAQLEKNLVDIESKRSEMLLGRIYKAVRETAVENGVSVVIDKSAILFGQGSVDLTGKVLKRLEASLP